MPLLETFQTESDFNTVHAAPSVLELRNSRLDSSTTVGRLSVPAILNISHCASLLVFLVESTNFMRSLKISVSQYMLSSIWNYVNCFVLLLIRLTAARSSASLFRTLKYLMPWNVHCKNQLGKISAQVIAMLFASPAYGLFTCVKTVLQFPRVEIEVSAGRHPTLGLAVILLTAITDSTAIPFALSYVVVKSGEVIFYILLAVAKNFVQHLFLDGWRSSDVGYIIRKPTLCARP